MCGSLGLLALLAVVTVGCAAQPQPAGSPCLFVDATGSEVVVQSHIVASENCASPFKREAGQGQS
jgi:hypothetical protein